VVLGPEWRAATADERCRGVLDQAVDHREAVDLATVDNL
jgi:hypothetical protein